MSNTAEKRFDFEAWSKGHRQETIGLLKSIENQEISMDEFVGLYKALGIPRTSPAKGRGIYRFIKRVGFIK